jgi:hypothetical protein
MSTCSLIDDIFEFGGLKMKVEKMRISDSGLYTERNNNRILKSLVARPELHRTIRV